MANITFLPGNTGKYDFSCKMQSIFSHYYVLHSNTSSKFYPVQLKSVFSISVEYSVDPD